MLGHGIFSSIAAVESTQFTHDFSLTIGQGLSIHQDDTTKSFRTIAHGFCTFHHGDSTCRTGIEFGRVIHAPLLSLLAHSIVHNQQAVAIHAVHHGFGDGRSCLNHAHATHLFEHSGESVSQIFGNVSGPNGVCHCILRVHHALSAHHSFVELIAHGEYLHTQRLVVAHFLHGNCQRIVADGTK